MNPRQALKVVTEYVDDASSFAETFEGIPNAFGDPDRPIATNEGVNEALRSLADFLAEEPVAELLAEPHERFEAAADLLRGHLTDTGGWGVPTGLEDDGWTQEEYRADLEDALSTLEGARDAG